MFDFDLFARLPQNENSFVSPMSVSVALGMVSTGAAAETEKVMAECLNSPVDLAERNSYYKKIMDEFANPKECELRIANALWSDLDFKPTDAYKKNVKENFSGVFEQLDFKKFAGNSADIINRWVEKQTNDKIKNLVDERFCQDQRMILTNAIYFKGMWKTKFNEKQTVDQDWRGKNKAKCRMMKLFATSTKYYEDKQYQAIELDYKGDELSMVIVLPVDTASTKAPDAATYKNIVSKLKTTKVNVSLPKFKLETTVKMKELLIDMGLGVAFSNAANFSRMSTEAVKISDVIHKAFVAVDEEGTEAAAATAVGMMRRCVSFTPDPIKNFVADHPFTFVIRNKKTDSVYFLGKLVNPS